MSSPLICSLSHPLPVLAVLLCPQQERVVKLLEPLLQEGKHLTVGVPFFLQEHALRTGVVPDFPVEDREEPVPHVDVLDEDEDEDEDEAIHGDLNPPPRYHGRPLDLPNKSRHEGHLETLNQADLQR